MYININDYKYFRIISFHTLIFSRKDKIFICAKSNMATMTSHINYKSAFANYMHFSVHWHWQAKTDIRL